MARASGRNFRKAPGIRRPSPMHSSFLWKHKWTPPSGSGRDAAGQTRCFWGGACRLTGWGGGAGGTSRVGTPACGLFPTLGLTNVLVQSLFLGGGRGEGGSVHGSLKNSIPGLRQQQTSSHLGQSNVPRHCQCPLGGGGGPGCVHSGESAKAARTAVRQPCVSSERLSQAQKADSGAGGMPSRDEAARPGRELPAAAVPCRGLSPCLQD